MKLHTVMTGMRLHTVVRLAAVGIAALALTVPVAARHRHRAESGIAGQFDYYLLSLSWSPAFCQQSPGSAECNGSRRFGFIVHGLWPQNERGWPENCPSEAAPSDADVQGMLDIMPARGLIEHEWAAHGTCSGLAPGDFFALVRRAYREVAIPPSFTAGSAAINQSPQAITDAFLAANPRFPPQSIVATCSGQGAPRLREMHLCFDRDLGPRACSADVLKAACRASSVIVPPIR